jgi:dCTP deaminase
VTVLSGAVLIDALKRGELVVSPILSIDQVGDISIDVRLGTVALVVRGSGLSYVDPRQYLEGETQGGKVQEKGRRQKFDRFDVPFRQPLLLHPGTLTLVPTLEWFKLPNELKGIVTARSSWAREGLNIATATFVDPGYTGVITLELSNLGSVPIAIYPGMRIAQIAFYRVEATSGGQTSAPLRKRDRQFNMSFEPQAGRITKGDEAFIPPRTTVTGQ